MSRRTLYSDILLGPICFHGGESDLLTSAELLRLRHIKQLSTCYLFNPYAIHTRFHHTIGLAGIVNFFVHAQTPENTPDPQDHKLLVMAALCHDIGHSAWSHIGEVFSQIRGYNIKHDDISARLVVGEFEKYFSKWKIDHNRVCEIINDECDQDMVADLIRGRPPVPPRHRDGSELTEGEKTTILRDKGYLGNIIKGPADFDRAEFLMRDSFMSSALTGLLDVRKIAENLCITNQPGTGNKILAYSSLNFAEAMLTARELLYPGLYLESRNLIAEEIFMRALNKIYLPEFDIWDFWFSTDVEVLQKMHKSRDNFVKRICKLMDCYQTYDLVAEINLEDDRLDLTSRTNIKYLGSDIGRGKILQLEEDVADQVRDIEREDFVVGCWVWGKPAVMDAPVVLDNKLSTIGMESRLLEVFDTDAYINNRSKLVVGVYRNKIQHQERIVKSVIENLGSKNYVS